MKSIYKDPQAAALKIEQTILAGKVDQLPDILYKAPDRAGELRGSGRLIDRITLAGKERKKALHNVSLAVSKIRELQSFYENAYKQRIDSLTRDRERMKVAIPSLSQAAVAYMKNVKAGRESYPKIPDNINKEFLNLQNALDKRFGQDAIHKYAFNLSKAIPSKQSQDKRLINELQAAVQFLQQKHIQEQNNAISRKKSKDVTR